MPGVRLVDRGTLTGRSRLRVRTEHRIKSSPLAEASLVALVLVAVISAGTLAVIEPVAGLDSTTCLGREATHIGTAADDVIVGSAGDDVIVGLGGDDTLLGRGGDDLQCGGPGADLLEGGQGADLLVGGSGPDDLRGGPGDDELRGGRGRDRLAGMGGDDLLRGGSADDRLLGGHDRDRTEGGSGSDTCPSSEWPVSCEGPATVRPGDIGCVDFSTWNDAQVFFDRHIPHHRGVRALDTDGDGQACEGLSGSPGHEAAPAASSIALGRLGRRGYVANEDSGTVTAFHRSGRILWETPVGARPRTVGVHPTRGTVYTTAFGADRLVALDPRSGPSWRRRRRGARRSAWRSTRTVNGSW